MTPLYANHKRVGNIEFSGMKANERSFVADSWTHALVDVQGHGERSGSGHRHAYLVSSGLAVDALLDDPNVVIIVARDAECAPRAFGWAAGTEGSVLWISVKRDHRREGIARLLLHALEHEVGRIEFFGMHSRQDQLAEKLGLTYRAYVPSRKSA